MRRRLPLLLALILCLAVVEPAAADNRIRVFYAGPDGGVRLALSLSADFTFVPDPSQADVLVLNDSAPPSGTVETALRRGAGVVLILGPHTSIDVMRLLCGPSVQVESRDSPLSLTPAPGVDDPVFDQVPWTSSPQVRQRFVLQGAQLEPLVIGFREGSTILGRSSAVGGTAFVMTASLDESNPQIQDWPYFNYLVYHLVARAAGRQPLPFSDYPASPVPHAKDQAVLYLAMGGVLVVSGLAFWLVRRYSLAHPEALDRLVADRTRFEAHEAHTDWEEIGFHRPLGGFLFALMIGLVLFVPLIIYQNLILPVYVLPSAQALGIWGRVTQFFVLVWSFFDMGTAAAFIKYLSQHRVDDPRRGILFGQVFVWWQALSGAVQVAAFVLLAGSVMPRTAFALYSWSVIVHSVIQIPGFYQVFRNALTGLQRFDYAQMLDIALGAFLPMLTQPVLVTLMLLWSRAHPAYGLTMSGLIGMGLAGYAAEALTFAIGLWLYRRLGYTSGVLFLAHFDGEVVKTAFRFGIFEMLGSIAWGAGQAVEILITQARLVNYAEVWGNWVIASNFIYAFQVLQTLYSNVMPSISEAFSHARRALSQYYSALSYKWGAIVSGFITAVLLATGDRFILGASGPEFVRAAAYAMPLILWGALQYPSWVGDNVQLAVNRPYLKAACVAGEQIIRLALAFILIERFQVYALIAAYFVGILTKDIVAYFLNNRLCFRQRFYVWQSLIAPLLATAVHFAWLRWLGSLIWHPDQMSSVLVFFIGILPSYPVYAFLYAWFGGWDDGTLVELRRAAELSSFMRWPAWLFWAASAQGARLSPLHGRFPIDIRPAAMAEARALTDERVSL